MDIAYFGSPEIAATVLKELLSFDDKDIKIALVVTQPDKRAGKKMELKETKVKELARRKNLPLFDKELSSNHQELIDSIKAKNIELGIVYAYGGYLQKDLLTIPKYGFINIHFSLLPKYRGASPIAYPLIMGDSETGVTLIQLNEVLDGGDIISKEKLKILPDENRTALEKRLTEISIPMIMKHIADSISGKKIQLQSQNDEEATTTGLIKKSDGYISLSVLKKSLTNQPLDNIEIPSLLKKYILKYPQAHHSQYYENSSLLIYNYYRGLHQWPGIWTTIRTSHGQKRLKLTDVVFSSNQLKIVRVQLEGKNEVEFNTFNKAYNIFNTY